MIRVTALELPLVNAFARLRKQYDLLVGQKVKMAFLLDTRRLSSGSAITVLAIVTSLGQTVSQL